MGIMSLLLTFGVRLGPCLRSAGQHCVLQQRSFSLTTADLRLTKEIIYGTEEGHGTKNEVRKPLWYRKRRLRATGRAWRAQNELTEDPFDNYNLKSLPDWSFRDGKPGYLLPDQQASVDQVLDLTEDVGKCMKIMGMFNESEESKSSPQER